MLGSYRNLIWLIPVTLMLSSPLWQDYVAHFLTPRGGYDKIAEQAYKETSQDFIMDDVTITFSTGGFQTWTIKAEQAQTGETDREIHMIDVDALYNKKGASPVTITSKTGTYHMDDQHLILIDDVVIIKPVQHEELYSDLLHYYDTTKMLISPGKVEIKGPKFHLKGGRMDYNVSTGAYDFNDRVDVVL
ncbi:MAG: LPS export ABC transporter periplasmic protein LptC [Candidatus Electrothrix sp. AR4]|nr:LPS export ABC transporter periplasmic protein LptC [Candidatus Electrothrix sp. AR4]